jgi:acetyl-CoA acetyltransferase
MATAMGTITSGPKLPLRAHGLNPDLAAGCEFTSVVGHTPRVSGAVVVRAAIWALEIATRRRGTVIIGDVVQVGNKMNPARQAANALCIGVGQGIALALERMA